MSAVRYFGRRWTASPEDFTLSSSCSIFFDAVVLALAVAGFVTISETDGCDTSDSLLKAFRIIWIVLPVTALLLDIAMLKAARSTRLFEPNIALQVLFYIRFFVGLASVGWLIAATFYYANDLEDRCVRDGTSSALEDIYLALLIIAWVGLLSNLCCCFWLYDWTNGLSREAAWALRLKCMTCGWCWRWRHPDEEEKNPRLQREGLYRHVTGWFLPIFDIEGLTPSDFMMGLRLVKAAQVEAVRTGEKRFYFTAIDADRETYGDVPGDERRWFPPVPQMNKAEPSRQPQSDVHEARKEDGDAHVRESSRGSVPKSEEKKDFAKQPEQRAMSEIPTETPAAIRQMAAKPAAAVAATVEEGGGGLGKGLGPRKEDIMRAEGRDGQFADAGRNQALERAGSVVASMREPQKIQRPLVFADDPAYLASLGIQPSLGMAHWRRLADARYYFRFAEGALGWPWWVAHEVPMSIFKWLCCCSLPPKPCLKPIPPAVYLPGCAPCNCSLSAFMRLTNVELEDVLYADIDNDIGKIVWYAAIDRQKDALVIACRGTMSPEDMLTDFDAGTKTLEKFGMPDNRSHAGIVRAAARIFTELKKYSIVDNWVTNHPGRPIIITGHSLGAGMAVVLTLIMHRDYPTVHCFGFAPPPCVNREFARSPEAMRYFTIIVNDKDIVPRLSLRNMHRLRLRMTQALRDRVDNDKFLIKRKATERKYTDMIRLRSGASHRETYYLFDYLPKTHDSSPEPSGTTPVPTEEWDVLFLPGRIYHIVRAKPPRLAVQTSRCFGLVESPPASSYAVYPADPGVFQEIMVDPSMLVQHMPHRYHILKRLKFPPELAQDPPNTV